jgi:FMN phosphatase YigB (HAD superfamily)
MMAHAIWSDFRGVLTPPLREGIRKYCEDRTFTPEQIVVSLRAIAGRYDCPDGMAVLDTGILDERQWTAEIERELADRFGVVADLTNFGTDWWRDQRVDEDWIAALRGWRDAGVFVGLISNLPTDWKAHFAAFSALHGLFDDVLLSCDIGARKPEPEIFRQAQARSGLPAECNILVDDLTSNVDGAVRAGWIGIASGGEATRSAIDNIESILRGANQ